MKINKNTFGIAGALTIGLVYLLIIAAIKFRPYESLKLLGTISMIPDLENLSPYFKIQSDNLILGLSLHLVSGYLVFFISAFLYNLFSRSK